MPRATSCLRMRSPPTPAVSGTKRRARSWTRTVSGTTWEVSKRPTPRCSAGSRRSHREARWIEDPGPRPSEGRHSRPARRGGEECTSGSRFRGGPNCTRREARRDGGRERRRGRRYVPQATVQPDDRGVRVGGCLLRIGVTVFPGSNCDRDALYGVERMGAEAVELWHADHDLKDVDAVIVPGGFSYGDYLRCGAIARFAPVMQEVVDAARKGMPVLGICNGFQILCEAHLLPGALIRNHKLHFVCRDQWLKV